MPPRAKATKVESSKAESSSTGVKKPVGRPPTKRAREPAKTNFAKRLKRKEEQQSTADMSATHPPVVAQPASNASPTTADDSSRRRADEVPPSRYQDLWLAERRNSARLYDERNKLRDEVQDRERFIQMQLCTGACQTYVNRYGQDDVDAFLRRVRTDLVEYAREQLGSMPPSHPSYALREFIAHLSDQIDALARDSFAVRGYHTVEDDEDDQS